MAGGGGFEPPLAESESAVLPLDEPPNDSYKLKVTSYKYKGNQLVSKIRNYCRVGIYLSTLAAFWIIAKLHPATAQQ